MILRDVIFNYTQIAKPTLAPKKTDVYQWQTGLALTKEQTKLIKKEFPKMRNQIKMWDAEEYEEKFKTPAPFGDQNYTMNVTQKCKDYKGNDLFPPKLYFVQPAKKGGKAVAKQDNQKLVGNGSKGHVSITAYKHSDKDGEMDVLCLGDMIIIDHVHYEAKGSEMEDMMANEFGFEIESEERPAILNEAEAQEATAKDDDDGDDFDDDDIPC